MYWWEDCFAVAHEALTNALAVVAVGNYATFGGLPKANLNPTSAVSVLDLVKDKKPVLNLPGCPYNPVNLTATIVHFLTFKELPAIEIGLELSQTLQNKVDYLVDQVILELNKWGHQIHPKV